MQAHQLQPESEFEFQLEQAIRAKNERDVIKLLKQGSLDPLKKMEKADPMKKDSNPQTQLETNYRNSMGKTPLYLAVESRDLNITKRLLQHGSNPNVGMPTGFVPLHVAARNNDEPMIRLLLHHGADPTVPNGLGFTPTQLADVRTDAWLLLQRATDGGSVTPPPPEPPEHAALPDIVYTWIKVQHKKQQILEEAKAKKKKGKDKGKKKK